HGISSTDTFQVRIYILLAFLAALACFGFAHNRLVIGTTTLVEDAIYNMRLRLLHRLQSVTLRAVERANIEHVLLCVTSEMGTISSASFNLATLGEQTLILVATTLYLAWLSPPGLVLAMAFMFTAAFIQSRNIRQIGTAHKHTFSLEGTLMEMF